MSAITTFSRGPARRYGHHPARLKPLYAAFQLVPASTLGNQTPGVAVFPIDPTAGQLRSANFRQFKSSRRLARPESWRNRALRWEGSSAAGLLESSQIRSDGTTLAPQSLPVVSPNSPPSTMLVDGSGQLLYVQQGGQATVYTIDKTTGVLCRLLPHRQLPYPSSRPRQHRGPPCRALPLHAAKRRTNSLLRNHGFHFGRFARTHRFALYRSGAGRLRWLALTHNAAGANCHHDTPRNWSRRRSISSTPQSGNLFLTVRLCSPTPARNRST